MIVLDASVLCKWFLSEQGHEVARALLKPGASLAAPDIARIEVADALLRHARTGAMTQVLSDELCGAWKQMLADGILTLESSNELFERAFKIAREIRHPLADCLYVALAVSLDATLMTADESLAKRASAVHKRVRLLAKAA